MKAIYSLFFVLLIFSLSMNAQILKWETYCFSDNQPSSQIQQVNGALNDVLYKSANGVNFSPTGTFRALTICVNIIYDQTPNANPCPSQDSYWSQVLTEGINQNPPPYLLGLYDINPSTSYNGVISRLYAESSFNQLQLLSDFMVVNIKQSTITPTNRTFGVWELMNAVIVFINNSGGLNTVYNHNLITDYDYTQSGNFGLPKGGSDQKIDIINFLVRNPSVSYGGLNIGSGYSYLTPKQFLKINNNLFSYNTGTYQGVGDGNLLVHKKRFKITL